MVANLMVGKQSKNMESGFLTLDFIFALTIAMGICSLLFMVCFSFINVEIAQYIAFSAARAHSAGNLTMDDQVNAARAKYKQLVESKELGNVFQNGWITASKPAQLEVYSGPSTANQDYNAGDAGGSSGIPFIGVRFNLTFNLLDLNVPFLGRTSDGDEDNFKAKVGAYLIREPTVIECQEYMKALRYDAILQIDPRFSQAATFKQEYMPLEDNGC